MLKKYVFLSVLAFFGFSLKANFLKYLPAKSEIRLYCQNNEDNPESQVIVKVLEALSRSSFFKKEIDLIDAQIKILNKKLPENVEYPEKYKKHIAMKKTKLLIDKANLEKNYLPFNFLSDGDLKEKNEFNRAVANILNIIDSKNHNQEWQYLQEGLENVKGSPYHPWNTLSTRREKIKRIGDVLEGVLGGGFMLLIFGAYILDH